MIKDKLSSNFQPSSSDKIAYTEFDFEIFTKPHEGQFLKPEGGYDIEHEDVKKFYSLLAPAMIWYVDPQEHWDLSDVANNAVETSNETIVISRSHGEVDGVGNVEFHTFKNLQVAEINGVVVNPEFRGSGVASWIIRHIIEIHTPDIVSGSTNSEVAALSRARILRKYGYTTFAGGQLLELAERTDLNQSQPLLREFLVSQGYDLDDDDQRVITFKAPYPKFKKTDRVSIQPEDMGEAYWHSLQRIFNTIVAEQKHNSGSLIQVPLLSIR